MSVISISLTESSEQIVSGIPRFVSLSANIPCNIFYTVDGSLPTIYSTIYTDKIYLPTEPLQVTLKVFATNGFDSSPVLDFFYETREMHISARLPRSSTDAQPNDSSSGKNTYPFGSAGLNLNQKFTGTQNAGLNVYDPNLPSFPNGFDASGAPANFTNKQQIGIPTQDFPNLLQEDTVGGKNFGSVGFLPKTKVSATPKIPEYDDISNKLFDPKAMVIFQDFTKPADPDTPIEINRIHFSLENTNKTRDGNKYFNSGLDAPPATGSFLRQHYNPTDQTMTYYYFDSIQNRWIISKTIYRPSPDEGKLYNRLVWSNKPGGQFVFKWIPFKGNIRY